MSDKCKKMLNKLNHLDKVMKVNRPDSSKFINAKKIKENCLFNRLSPMDYGIISKGLHRLLTNHDLAEILVGPEEGWPIDDIFNLSNKSAKALKSCLQLECYKIIKSVKSLIHQSRIYRHQAHLDAHKLVTALDNSGLKHFYRFNYSSLKYKTNAYRNAQLCLYKACDLLALESRKANPTNNPLKDNGIISSDQAYTEIMYETGGGYELTTDDTDLMHDIFMLNHHKYLWMDNDYQDFYALKLSNVVKAFNDCISQLKFNKYNDQ